MPGSRRLWIGVAAVAIAAGIAGVALWRRSPAPAGLDAANNAAAPDCQAAAQGTS